MLVSVGDEIIRARCAKVLNVSKSIVPMLVFKN